jgi:hypothetical protein
MSSQGIMSSKKASNNPGFTKGLLWPRCIGLSQWVRTLVFYLSNNPGLCSIKGQKSGFCNQTGAQNQFLSLPPSTTLLNTGYQSSILSFFLYSTLTLMDSSFQQTFEQNCPLRDCCQFHFLRLQHVQGLITALQCAG